ncbi:uncharacterized protein LOC120167084 [Hibiscus syriacus]|uniref:uncharacterized protein LOC120167084 n=1 Tax=Hibiscus syriacus TaxID=106335 RepID=UPI0019206F76|nr:uncharacterized protein LOC120167084 [Hibiscus syriacus]
MDFVSGLPLTLNKRDSIWAIVDRLTNSTHFLHVRNDFSMEKYAELYIREVIRLHRVSVSIVYDRDPQFTSRFWKSLHEALGTRLNFSTAFHPQTDGKSERISNLGRYAGSVVSVSSNFSTQSSSRVLAEIAARVVEEDDDGFEFAFVCRDPKMSPVSADEIFYNGQIRPTYPVSDTSLLNNNIYQTHDVKPRSRRLPLRELMGEERETNSCSASEGGELDRVTPGTYCVWTPKAATSAKTDDPGDATRATVKTHMLSSGCNRDEKAGDMRRSILPNRQDLVGIFSNINGLSRSLPPF